MSLVYNFIIWIYKWSIYLAAPFQVKAKLWVRGRKNIMKRLQNEIKDQNNIVWFHAASLGEFEQGRPVIEALKEKKPEYKILLTFFSPSGYEIRKNYKGADYIFYLPIDTIRNAKNFVQIVRPKIAIFIKYEYWFNYIHTLYKENIPVYMISAIFRKNQHFFKWYGGWFRKQLRLISCFFVQNEESIELLKSIHVNQVELSGDTRFDRVISIAQQKKEFPIVDKFSENSIVLLAGSTWPADEKIISSLVRPGIPRLKLIIAPHEISPERLSSVESLFKDQKIITFSEATLESISNAQVLLIDGIGYLSGLYQYCNIAYIGGGFGNGIHNILEAATFGKPILFGPNFQKFKEAVDLVMLEGAFVVKNESELIQRIELLLSDQPILRNSSKISSKYVDQNSGATQMILAKIEKSL